MVNSKKLFAPGLKFSLPFVSLDPCNSFVHVWGNLFSLVTFPRELDNLILDTFHQLFCSEEGLLFDSKCNLNCLH